MLFCHLEDDPVFVLGSGSQVHWARDVGWITDVRPAIDMLGGVIDSLKEMGLIKEPDLALWG